MNTLRDILKRQGRTQSWLAGQLGVRQQTVSRYIRGQRKLSADDAARIARLLDVTIDAVMGSDRVMTDQEYLLLKGFRDLPEWQRAAILAAIDGLARATKAAPEDPPDKPS